MTKHEGQISQGEQGELDRLHQAQVVILDAGSQYRGQIDRRVRELEVSSIILPIETPAEELHGCGAIIISGGPDNVLDPDARHCDPRIFELGKPILGDCYGMHEIAFQLGGTETVKVAGIREDGSRSTWLEPSTLFNLSRANQEVLMSHGVEVVAPPPGFRIIGGHSDEDGDFISAIGSEAKKIYGVQFHPEVDDTPEGETIFSNFLFGVAGLEKDFTPIDQEELAIKEIREVVGDRHVALYLSGGKDSTVLADLIIRALPSDKIFAFHIDNGFMRIGESLQVAKNLSKELGINVELVDAVNIFRRATTVIDGEVTKPLSQVTDTEQKRMIIGDTFAVLMGMLTLDAGLPDDTVLAQGTLRPDIIESGSHLAGIGQATIKTHHNDSPEIRELRRQNRVVEPLKELYKDQVIELGRRLGVSEKFLMRQPFPGPGLAIRIICAERSTEDPTEQIVLQEQLDNLFAAFNGRIVGDVMPFQTVGTGGDDRTYKALAVLRTTDPNPKWEELIENAARVTRVVGGVNRVAYAFRNVPPAETITPTLLEEREVLQLSHADMIVRKELTEANLDDKLSQVPVILAPISFGSEGGRSIAIRPFSTRDFMTGKPAVPGIDIPLDVVDRIVNRILREVPGITQVLYDLSSKPPATTEWE
jgi:GMP synthase (glutamine-hydrolysing)